MTVRKIFDLPLKFSRNKQFNTTCHYRPINQYYRMATAASKKGVTHFFLQGGLYFLLIRILTARMQFLILQFKTAIRAIPTV